MAYLLFKLTRRFKFFCVYGGFTVSQDLKKKLKSISWLECSLASRKKKEKKKEKKEVEVYVIFLMGWWNKKNSAWVANEKVQSFNFPSATLELLFFNGLQLWVFNVFFISISFSAGDGSLDHSLRLCYISAFYRCICVTEVRAGKDDVDRQLVDGQPHSDVLQVTMGTKKMGFWVHRAVWSLDYIRLSLYHLNHNSAQ